MEPELIEIPGEFYSPKILAMIKAWRIRRIFGLTMTKSKARIILDHDDLATASDFNAKDIRESRKNACRKFSDFISSLEEYGGWV